MLSALPKQDAKQWLTTVPPQENIHCSTDFAGPFQPSHMSMSTLGARMCSTAGFSTMPSNVSSYHSRPLVAVQHVSKSSSKACYLTVYFLIYNHLIEESHTCYSMQVGDRGQLWGGGDQTLSGSMASAFPSKWSCQLNFISFYITWRSISLKTHISIIFYYILFTKWT